MISHRITIAAMLAAPLFAGSALAQDADEQYLRKSEGGDGVIALEIATRDFVPEREEAAEPGGPRIGLVGVAHIGDRSFYRDLSALLGEYDIVLYEAVRPAGVGGARGETDDERLESTQKAAAFLASVLEAHRADRGEYPASLDELREFARTIDPMITNWIANASVDAWGTELAYRVAEEGAAFTVSSAAAPGRDGAGVVLATNEDAVEPLSLDRDNIQKQIADALGLAYQLEALDYGAANWRSSDMSIDELTQAFQARGLDFGPLQGTLGGSTLTAHLGKFLLRLITMLDAMAEGAISDMVKVLMIDLLSDQAMVEQGLSQLGEGFEEVIIDERNQVVMEDLKRVLAEEANVRSVAILYGAGHMPDLAQRLSDQLGYTPGELRWLTAMSVDLNDSSVDKAQIMQMRRMLQSAMRRQMQNN